MLLLVGVLAASSCADDRAGGEVGIDPGGEPNRDTASTTSSTFPPVEIPGGRLVVVPTQNREDPAENQFQVQVHNGTDERLEVVGVQFVWEGFSSPPTVRDSTVVGGQVIDFPVPFGGAECRGDGGVASMPDVSSAVVVLDLGDDTTRSVPVFDRWNVARRLYLDDCERRALEALVGIEWVDLHESERQGRPVTAGSLRVTRRDAIGEVTIASVSNTIPFTFEAVDSAVGEPVAVLAADDDVVEVPVRFVESRCDPHALAEIKQPFKFVSQVEIDGAPPRAYVVVPPATAQIPMRLTADEACVATGKVVFAGDPASVGSVP
jgi:hypothetical protein